MKTKKTLVLFLFFLFEYISGKDLCIPKSCSFIEPIVLVRFPFRLVDRQPSSCGLPGFDLLCDKKNQTILKLPSSRSFIVKHISYATREIDVDPDFCGPEGLARIKLTGTPFENSLSEGYTFYNCSSTNGRFAFNNLPMLPLLCPGSVNHSLYAMETLSISNGNIPDSCKKITTISVPVRHYGSVRSVLSWNESFCETCKFGGRTCEFKDGEITCIGSSTSFGSTFGSSTEGSVNHSVYALERLMTSYGHIPESCKDIAMISVPVLRNYGGIIRSILGWSMPFCETCELAGGACAFKDGETTCIGSSHEGDSRRTTYSIIIFTSVPTVICAIMFLCCILGTVRSNDQGQHQSIGLSAIAITPQTRSTTGLDRSTIESYPKTILGESCEIPEDDSACAICLSDYTPKEVVRTIPECSHYFHVDCIDEWLKLNATCPVCRKLSQGSLLVTPCSSTTLNSTNSSRTTSQ